MSKKSSHKSRTGRGANAAANRVRLPSVRRVILSPISLIPPSPALALEDRRYYHPLRSYRPPAAVVRSDARQVLGVGRGTKARISFAVPHRVAICVRRQRRKEVLFARRVAGSGMRMRKPKYNHWSRVSCNRSK